MTIAVGGVGATSAATVANAWRAKIGSGGANGTATIQTYTTGAGSIVLRLSRLQRSRSLPVTLSKGTCATVGTTLMSFASVRTTSIGSASRSTSLTVTQVNKIKAATTGTGGIAIRIGSGTSRKCGLFAALPIAPYVAASVTVGGSPSGVAIDPSGVWVTNWWDNSLSRIDAGTNAVLSVVPLDISGNAGPEKIASGAGSLWVTVSAFDDAGQNAIAGSIKRVDPSSGQTLATIPVGKGPYDIVVGLDAVWVPLSVDNAIVRIDPATNQVIATIPVDGGPTGVAIGFGALWAVSLDGSVTRIDPATNQVVATVPTQTTGAYIVTGGGAVWVTHFGDIPGTNGSLSRIDPATNQVVANVNLGSDPESISFAGGSVWVGMAGEPAVVRVSATTTTVLKRISVSSKVYAIAATEHDVWVVHNLPVATGAMDPPNGSVSRIGYAGIPN